jgi:hypothetical protein
MNARSWLKMTQVRRIAALLAFSVAVPVGLAACSPPPSRLSCSSAATYSRPLQGTTETVTVKSQAGAQVVTTASFSNGRYATTKTTNAHGIALMGIPVGTAPTSFKVNVATVVIKNGQRATCSTSFLPALSPFGRPIGSTIRFPTSYDPSQVIDVTVNSVHPTGPLTDYNGTPLVPKAGRFIYVEISAVSISGTVSINPYEFSFKSPDGTNYGYNDNPDLIGAVDPAGAKPELNAEDLAPGRRAHGFITLDVPTGRGEVVISTFGDSSGSWTVPAA